MDKWRRGKDGVLFNDDTVGYENAKRRIASQKRKKEEKEALNERMLMMESKIARLELRVDSIDKTIGEIVNLCKSLTEAVKMR